MKDKILIILFILYISIFSILHIIIKDEKISYEERRNLKTFPTYKLDNNYINELEDYLLDHFPLRNQFRNIKSYYNYNIIKQLDNNGVYIKDNKIYKTNYPTNKDSINNFIIKTKEIEKYLTANNNKYIMIIPDKNYYLKSNNFLQIDYNYLFNEINKLNYNKININNILNINDYYETDTHWKQQNLDKVILKISKSMNLNYEKLSYKENIYNNFYGVYYKDSGIIRKPEKLIYYTNNVIENATVKYLENKDLNKVYNIDKLNKIDSYDVYLDGASSFIEIINNNSNTNKELIIFRDSFASSITPLLINYYNKITLIDNRYINSNNYLKYIEFNNQDILFMYSTLLINDSFSLKG